MVPTGRVPLLLLAGLAPVVVWPSGWTVAGWLVLVAAAVAADARLAADPADLGFARTPLESVRVGEETATELRVANRSRGTARLLMRDAWQPSAGATRNRHRHTLAPGDEAALLTPLLPRRRGDLTAVGVTVRSYGPLGLGARQRTGTVPGALRALPAFGSRKHLRSRLRLLRELDGRTAVRVRGQGTEFDSLREYVRGDDVRSIDWRASARSRTVVVRTWQPERDRHVVIVLDTSRTSAGRIGDVPRLDSAMDAALLLASLATRAGDRVDVVAGDRQARVRVRTGGTRDAAARLQDAFATVQPALVEADWTALAGSVAQLARHRALVVLLTPLEPAAVEESLLPVLPTLVRHHRVVVASVGDPTVSALARERGTVAEVYAAAAAERAALRRRRTATTLGALGVDVVEGDAESLPPALADHYLLLKARGLL